MTRNERLALAALIAVLIALAVVETVTGPSTLRIEIQQAVGPIAHTLDGQPTTSTLGRRAP